MYESVCEVKEKEVHAETICKNGWMSVERSMLRTSEAHARRTLELNRTLDFALLVTVNNTFVLVVIGAHL